MSISLSSFARRLSRWLLAALAVLVAVLALSVVVAQTEWFHEWLRRYLVREAGDFINGELAVNKLEGSLLGGVAFSDVAVTQRGQAVIEIKQLKVEYSAWKIVTQGLWIDSIEIDRPLVRLERTETGWSIADLLRARSESAETQSRSLTIDRVLIHDGSVRIDDPHGSPSVDLPDRLDRVEADLSIVTDADRTALNLANVSFDAAAPDLRLKHLAARLTIKGDTIEVGGLDLRTTETAIAGDGRVSDYRTRPFLAVNLTAGSLSIPELGRVLISLQNVDVRPSARITASGPLDQLQATLQIQSPEGSASASVVADLVSTAQRVAGTVSVQHLNLAPFVKDPSQTSDLTADARIDLRSQAWSSIETIHGTVSLEGQGRASGYRANKVVLQASLDAGRAAIDARLSAYSTNMRTRGTVGFPVGTRPLSFDLRGRTDHVNLQALPHIDLPDARTDITLSFHARGSQSLPLASTKGRLVDVDAVFDDSDVPGAHVQGGSTARVGVRGRAASYGASATVHGVDLQRIGAAFAIPALAASDRAATRIDGQIDVEGSGTTIETLELTARGTIPQAEALGGHLSGVSFDAAVRNDRAQATVLGQFTDVDLSLLSGRADVVSRLTGSLDARATLEQVSLGLTKESITAAGRVEIGPTTVNGLALDHAVVDGEYAPTRAVLRTVDIGGRDISLTASGSLALDHEQESHLTFKGHAQRLEQLSALADIPLDGMARVEGEVTGNAGELRITGTLDADRLNYQDNGALTTRSTFDARMPDLTPSRTRVEAKTAATFVTVAGQHFNEVNATIGYDGERVTFDGTARQPGRTLDAAGSLAFVPEYQEVRLDRLTLTAANQHWDVPAGVQPKIQYGGGAVRVNDFRLASGDQSISASGEIGAPDDALDVTFTNIDVAAVDALLLREPQFSGRMNGSAIVSGATAAPAVHATMKVTNGGFRQFKYESLAADIDYGADGIGLDARLQQDQAQWITAKGHIPVAVLSAPPDTPSPGADHVVPTSAADSFDVTVDSSALSLGLIQGFTTEVTQVQGSLEAHLRVTGSAHDPHAEGIVAFHDGTMTLPSTGVSYKSIGGRLEFQPDRLHIDQITALDNHDSSLSITGDIAVHAGTIGGVQLWLNAGDFKILDNKAGNVRMQSDLEISGELRQPRINGDVSISTGHIDLDELLALTTTSAYSTKQTEFVTPVDAPGAAEPPATPFEALQLSLRIWAPDDLVVRARNLRSPGAAVGFGALNVTLGGDLTATKEPGGPVRIAGGVNTIRGTYDFQGRRFEILRDGSVRFDGVNMLNPTLDLRTRREIQGVEAFVTVRGTLNEPSIILTSNPPLEEADILALIVFNQPVNQLGEGQQVSLAARAQSLATGAVAGQIAQSIGAALNLDTFEIDLAPDSGSAPVVTIGQQLGRDLYVKLEQSIGESSSTNVILEYAFTRWLRLQSNVAESNSTQQTLFRRQRGSGADLIFLFNK